MLPVPSVARRCLGIVGLCLLGGWVCLGDDEVPSPLQLERVPPWLRDYRFAQPRFQFVRIRYTDSRSTTRNRAGETGNPAWGTWATDYPDADLNFSRQFDLLTSIPVDEPTVLSLTDPELPGHPFAYLTEAGQLTLSDEEVAGLRQYLTTGGFLLIDDFWGEAEWKHAEAEFKRVLPESTSRELPLEHKIFHCVFDLTERPQVPSIHVALQGRSEGRTWERPDTQAAHYRGILDEDGRMMVLFCHNTDLADGWERIDDDPWYAREFSAKRAYPMGINALFFALTQNEPN